MVTFGLDAVHASGDLRRSPTGEQPNHKENVIKIIFDRFRSTRIICTDSVPLNCESKLVSSVAGCSSPPQNDSKYNLL